MGLAAMVTVPASAQNFPTAPVRLIVPVPAGGVTDTMARLVAQGLSERWGQSVIVDNRPGGNYAVGAIAVERSAPDGYTLLVAPDSPFTINPHMTSKLSYNPKSFTSIMVLCHGTPMLVVNQALPATNVNELVAHVKSKPGVINYGSYGIGSYSHLSMEDLKQRTGMNLVHVPYRGAPAALTGLLTGDVSMLLLNLSSIEAYESSGKLRILAAADEVRAPTRQEFPTIAEAGVPGFTTSFWSGLFGPAGMPSELVRKIHEDVEKVLDSKPARDFFQKQSFRRSTLTPQQFGEYVNKESAHWGRLVTAVGAKHD